MSSLKEQLYAIILEEIRLMVEEGELLEEHIVKRGNKYCLLSKKTDRNLGCYPSKSGAEKRERQVQYFKHLEEDGAAIAAANTTASVGAMGYAAPFGAVRYRLKKKTGQKHE